MSAQDTRSLIRRAIESLQDAVPALKQLKLVLRLELRARGGDVPIWRVELPGPKIARDPTGHVRVSGDPAVTKLLGNVIRRQLIRGRA